MKNSSGESLRKFFTSVCRACWVMHTTAPSRSETALLDDGFLLLECIVADWYRADGGEIHPSDMTGETCARFCLRVHAEFGAGPPRESTGGVSHE